MKRNQLLLSIVVIIVVGARYPIVSAADEEARVKLQSVLNKRLDTIMRLMSDQPDTVSNDYPYKFTEVTKKDGYKFLARNPRPVLQRDRETLLICAVDLHDQGRDYSVDKTSRWIEAAWLEYRDQNSIDDPLDKKEFMSLADEMAYVEVSSHPDKAAVTVGRIHFKRKTTSDGFVQVDGKGKMKIHVEKDGYQPIDDMVELVPKEENKFEYKLTPQK